jgi:SSU ribosomal protein S3P
MDAGGADPFAYFAGDIDYAEHLAHTTFGIIGVKVWVFKGEVLPGQERHEQKFPLQQPKRRQQRRRPTFEDRSAQEA